MTRPGVKEKDDRGETMKKEEFIEEVRAAEEMLYHTALSVLRNEADTADAVQEALLKAYERFAFSQRRSVFQKLACADPSE